MIARGNRTRCVLRAVLGVISTLVMVVPSAAQLLPKDDGVFGPVPQGGAWSPPKRFGKHGVYMLAFLDPDRLVVAVQGEPKDRKFLLGTTLSFYGRRSGVLTETHRFTTEYLLIQMYPNIQDDRLITTWETGTMHRTGIFVWEKADLRLVLWEEWKNYPPEFLDAANTVVFAVGVEAGQPPEKAAIYRWDGKDYKLIPLVPWTERHKSK